MGLHTHLGELNCKVEVQLEGGGVEVGRSATSYHVTCRRALTLDWEGGRKVFSFFIVDECLSTEARDESIRNHLYGGNKSREILPHFLSQSQSSSLLLLSPFSTTRILES